MGASVSREPFTAQDVQAAIRRHAPSANVRVYESVVGDFYTNVIQGSADTITPQAVDAFLGQQGSLNPDEKRDLRVILLDVFKIQQGPADIKEATQIRFQPDATALQPRMAAKPVPDNAPPADYVTADPDPVLPDTKKMPKLPTLNRGGSGQAEAYTWDLAAYQQADVTGSYPSRGIPPATIPPRNVREGMSTMAGTKTITNEIYGPRVPRERGVSTNVAGSGSGAGGSTEIYPRMYGPTTGPREMPSGSGGGVPVVAPGETPATTILAGSGTRCPVPPDQGGFPGVYGSSGGAAIPQLDTGELTGTKTIPAAAFQIPAMAKINPVPYLPDFSRFQK